MWEELGLWLFRSKNISMAKTYFITTPIYYVNDVPHIGHAYTTVAADVFCRWKKRERPAVLLTGTDEHGAKIQEAAKNHAKTPKEYADEVSAEFKKTWTLLRIDYDRFIRTTDADHEDTAKRFLQKLYDAGYVKNGVYRGRYCIGHEKFMSAEELVDGKCPEHGKAPVDYEEENYYFMLSRFQDQITSLIENGSLVIGPEARKNEILGKLRQGLEDISISRLREKTSWGIELPWDTAHTMYVWVEALINYYTYGQPKELWPADLHIVGKDILWFHAVIWPAMLLAYGEEPPKKIFAHGFFSIDGQKMSKTLGNVITPGELIDKFGADATRYLLLSAFPFGTDGDFDWERLVEKYNADLANGIGNLAARITTLAEGITGMALGIDEEGNKTPRAMRGEYEHRMAELDFYSAIGTIQKLVTYTDVYLNEKKPWELRGEEKAAVMRNAIGMLAAVAWLVSPFMPETAKKIFAALGLEGRREEWGKATVVVRRGEGVLFPRLD